MEPVIELTGLSKAFKGGALGRQTVEALRGLDLQVGRGEAYGFLGPNGAGKSTTIKILVGLIRASSGRVRILGQSGAEALRRGQIGYLPENPSLYSYLTARELLTHFGHLHKLPQKQLTGRIEGLLDRVGIARATDQRIKGFSKGMVQRLALARALLHDPELLILDEPMSGLDPIGRRELRDLIHELSAAGKTIFFSSHVIPDVESVCSRVGILAQGQLVREATVEELLLDTAGRYELSIKGLDEKNLGPQLKTLQGLESRSGVGGAVQSLQFNSREQALAALDTLRPLGAEPLQLVPIRRALEDIVIEEVADKSRVPEPPESGAVS